MSKDSNSKENQTYEPGMISKYLERLIEIFEKDRFTPLTAFIFLVILGIIRSVSESLIYEYRVFSMYLVVQHTAFNFPVLIMGSLILSMAADTPLRKTYNAILPGFAIVILPPFVDYFILGYAGAEHSHLYAYYASDIPFFQKIGDLYPPNMLLSEEISSGLQRMVLSIMALSGLYVAVKVKIGKSIKLLKEKKLSPVLKKVCAIFFGVFGIWIVVWFIVAIVPTSISLEEEAIVIFDHFRFLPYTKYYVLIEQHGYTTAEVFAETDGLAEHLALQQRSLYLTMVFSVLSFGFMLLSMHLKYRKVLKKIFSSLKLTIILPTTISALLGSAVLHLTDPDFTKGWAIDPTYVLHFPYIFYIGAIGFLLGCFGCFILDFYREENILSKTASKNMAIVSFLAGGSYAFLMGPLRIFLIFILATLLMFVSFRREKQVFNILSSFTFSTACLIIYLLGVYSPALWKTKTRDVDGYVTIDLPRSPELSAEVLGLGIIIFLLILAVTLLTYVLDKELLSKWLDPSHIVLPMILIALAFLPALMFNDIDHLIVFGSLGFASVILTDEDLPFVPMGVSSLILIYILLSLWGL
ncbi:MAG: hypothetical protein V5A88_09140, partial [Candidatus Thermoplasmatota archaeon]